MGSSVTLGMHVFGWPAANGSHAVAHSVGVCMTCKSVGSPTLVGPLCSTDASRTGGVAPSVRVHPFPITLLGVVN